jgi:glycolate oxidase iron-sulfur subunit
MSGGTSLAFAPEERFLDCVHCGLCLTACPTYLETGHEADSPRGRIYLMHGLQTGTLAPSADVVRHLDLCLGCRACETACPSGVRYGALIEAARPVLNAHGRRTWTRHMRRLAIGELVANPRGQRLLRAAARWLPRPLLASLARRPSLPEWLRFQAALALGLPRAPRRPPLPRSLEAVGRARGTVALLPGCLAHSFFPDTNDHAARLLALAGYRVRTPGRPLCCGAMLLHLGHHDDALALARETLGALGDLGADIIAVTAAGCGAMLQSYGELLGDAGAALAARTRDVTAILAEAELPAPTHPVPYRVAYHDACHLAHGQGVRDAPRSLLRVLPGVQVVELPEADLCCGSAGTYNLTEPSMGRRLMLRKARHVVATGAALLAAANPGCVVQIRAGLAFLGARVYVCHPVDLLAAAHFDLGGATGVYGR